MYSTNTEEVKVRIISREEFLKLPCGVMFSKYEDCRFGDRCVKDINIGEHDFMFTQMSVPVKAANDVDYYDKCVTARLNGSSIELNYDCVERDGCFDSDQMFAVFEEADLLALREKLSKCVGA